MTGAHIPGGNVVGLHLAVGGGARLCGETPRGPAHTQAQTPAQARGRSFLPSGLSVAVVDAAFDAGFAAWACVIEGEAHVRTGHAHNSTHAELLAAALAQSAVDGLGVRLSAPAPLAIGSLLALLVARPKAFDEGQREVLERHLGPEVPFRKRG